MPNRYVICASCHRMNPSFGQTCDQCGAPIAGAAEESSQPAESVVKRTHFQPPTTIRLIGVWSIALPNVLAGAYMAFWFPRHIGGLKGFIAFWLTVGLTCVWLVIFYQVTKNYFFPRTKANATETRTLAE